MRACLGVTEVTIVNVAMPSMAADSGFRLLRSAAARGDLDYEVGASAAPLNTAAAFGTDHRGLVGVSLVDASTSPAERQRIAARQLGGAVGVAVVSTGLGAVGLPMPLQSTSPPITQQRQ